MPKKSIPMIGKVFGTLKVVCKDESKSTGGSKKFIVECTLCKKKKSMYGENIRRTEKIGSKGCDCATRNIKSRKAKKGSHVEPHYKTWEGMMRRCYSHKHEAYHRYGGRGIYVCEEWHDYGRFSSWLKDSGWVRGKTEIDRIDNDGSYSPDNCRLVSRIENQCNTSKNRFLHVNGEKMTLSEASRKYQIGLTTIKARLDAGWSDIKCIDSRDFRCKHQKRLEENGGA